MADQSLPKISVIITVHNIEKYIAECLDSVVKQDLKEIEIICVDDCSTDGSREILNQYRSDDRIKILELNKCVGPATARNLGYKSAKGEYIYQIDGDDMLARGALRRMYDCVRENNLELLTFSASAFADDEETLASVKDSLNLYQRQGKYYGVMTGSKLLAQLIEQGDFLGNLCCILASHSFLDVNNILQMEGLKLSADNNFEMYLKAQRAMCIPDSLYIRRFRAGSIVTSSKTLEQFESVLSVFAHELLLWHNYSFDVETETQIEKHFKDFWKYVEGIYCNVKDLDSELKMLPKHKEALLLYKIFFKGKNKYWTTQTENVIRDIKGYDNIIIYGAGNVGKEVAQILLANDIYHFVFAVTDNLRQKEVLGRHVYNISEFRDKKEECIVLIAVSQKYHQTFRRNLESIGLNNYLFIE